MPEPIHNVFTILTIVDVQLLWKLILHRPGTACSLSSAPTSSVRGQSHKASPQGRSHTASPKVTTWRSLKVGRTSKCGDSNTLCDLMSRWAMPLAWRKVSAVAAGSRMFIFLSWLVLDGSGKYCRSLCRQSFHKQQSQKVLEATIQSSTSAATKKTFAQLENYLLWNSSMFPLLTYHSNTIKGRISVCNWASPEIPMKWVQSRSKIDAGYVEADNMSHLHKAPWSNTLEIRFAHGDCGLQEVGKTWRLWPATTKNAHWGLFRKICQKQASL